jgi:hypothetical protein
MKKREKKIIDKTDSKRVKITMKDIMKDIGFTKIDPAEMKKRMDDHFKEDKKKVADDKIRYEKDLKAEKERFENICCPSCISTKKERNIISHMNGPVVCGGINSSTVSADYLICQGCGTMYVDINKKEITPQYRGYMSSHGLYNL